jgi:predicted ATPase
MSAADYLAIAQNYDILILKNVPRMGFAQRNEARRLITLIDALYDSKALLSNLEKAVCIV